MPAASTRISLLKRPGSIVAISAASHPPKEKPIMLIWFTPMSSRASRYQPAMSRMFMIQSRKGESPNPGCEGIISSLFCPSAS